MYLHIGKNVLIRQREILAIFDMDTATVSKTTKQFIHNAEEELRICNVCDDLPKSFILCNQNGKTVLYLSQLSSQTLLGRTKKQSFNKEE